MSERPAGRRRGRPRPCTGGGRLRRGEGGGLRRGEAHRALSPPRGRRGGSGAGSGPRRHHRHHYHHHHHHRRCRRGEPRWRRGGPALAGRAAGRAERAPPGADPEGRGRREGGREGIEGCRPPLRPFHLPPPRPVAAARGSGPGVLWRGRDRERERPRLPGQGGTHSTFLRGFYIGLLFVGCLMHACVSVS